MAKNYLSLVGPENLYSNSQLPAYDAEAAKAQFENDLKSDKYITIEFFNKKFFQEGRGIHHCALKKQFQSKYSVDIHSVPEGLRVLVSLVGYTPDFNVFNPEENDTPLADDEDIAEQVLIAAIKSNFPVEFTPHHKLRKEGVEVASIKLPKGKAIFKVQMTPALMQALAEMNIQR